MANNQFCICLITDTLCDANGVSRFIQDMAFMAREENKCFYAITASIKPYCKEQENLIILKPTIKTKMPWYPELDLVLPPFSKIKKAVINLKPNLIHISTPGPIGLYGLRIAKSLNIPISATYHTDFPSYIFDNTKSKVAKMVTKSYMRYFYKQFDGLFVRSKVYREILKNDIKINDSNIFEIKPGIDTNKFNSSFKDSSIWHNYKGISLDSIKALYVGRLTVEKNFNFLIETWKLFYTKYKGNINAELICVGEGKFLSQKDELTNYGIRFLGYKGGIELSKIYASSNLFLFPSTTDTLGQVVMEAQHSGLAVIVSNIGGPKDLINLEGESGFALPIDKEVWAKHIALLINDANLREKMGKNGIKAISKMGIKDSFYDFWNKNLKIGGVIK